MEENTLFVRLSLGTIGLLLTILGVVLKLYISNILASIRETREFADKAITASSNSLRASITRLEQRQDNYEKECRDRHERLE